MSNPTPTPGNPVGAPPRPGFHQWLWGFAERMDWQGRFPRFLWARLLRYYDRKNGYDLEYDER